MKIGRYAIGPPKDQPHAIAHVLQPTLWGENQKREPVSITADAQRMVPPARGPSPGAPKGIRSSARHGRRCGDACPMLALLRRADPGEWSLCARSGRSETAAWARSKVKTVLTLWSSARYRATRRAGWRRNCHAYAAIGVPGISRKFGGPDFARGSVSIRR